MPSSISEQTLKRLPGYLGHLKKLQRENVPNVSAKALAQALDLGEIQVRKDLAAVSNGGKPRVGYATDLLIKDLERYLGYNEPNNAVLIGAGRLGKALMSYRGF